MLSATLNAGLHGYGIGAKIRALRLKKKMGLVELGKHTGLSPAMLSKIERGRLYPTLPTLLRIALVFSVGLEFFFAGAREKPVVAVVRKSERVTLTGQAGRAAGGVSLRVARLSGDRAQVQLLPCGVLPGDAGPAAAARAPRRRVHLRAGRDALRPASTGRSTRWRRATRCISIPACRTRIGARAPARAAPWL